MPRVVHFGISVADPEAAAEFYREVFDWAIAKWEGPVDYWLVTTGEEGQAGIDGGLVRSEGEEPHTINSIDVPSIDEFVARVEAAGGKVVVPKTALPGVGYQAYCADPQGAFFGLHEEDPEAK